MLTGATLDGFANAVSRAPGVSLRDLAPFEGVEVHTRNTHYRLRVLNPLEGRVLIEGGAFFAVPVEATVAGASAGGSMLKVGWILDGFRLEILHAGERIITTSVRHIERSAPDSLPGPF